MARTSPVGVLGSDAFEQLLPKLDIESALSARRVCLRRRADMLLPVVRLRCDLEERSVQRLADPHELKLEAEAFELEPRGVLLSAILAAGTWSGVSDTSAAGLAFGSGGGVAVVRGSASTTYAGSTALARALAPPARHRRDSGG